LRIFVDLSREYRTELIGFPPGQEFNVLMSILGLVLLVWAYKFQGGKGSLDPAEGLLETRRKASLLQRISLAALVVIPLVMPSDWTQDVPERYGARHDGLEYSVLYPRMPDAKQAE
jgi:hypothetical protein